MSASVTSATSPSTRSIGPEPNSAHADIPARQRWCMWSILLLVAAVAWLTYAVLHWLLSGRLALWIAADLLPPPMFLVVPILLVSAIPLARLVRVRLPKTVARLVIVTAVAATALTGGDAGLNPAGLVSARPLPGPADLRIVSWNTQYWEQDDDPDHFYAALKRRPADVYLLQEYLYWANGPQQIDRLNRLRQEFPGYQIATIGELITVSRLPIIATSTPGTGTHAAQDFTEAYNTAKILRTDIRVHDRVVSLYNVHITVPVDADRNPLTRGFYQLINDRQEQRERQFYLLHEDLRGNANPRLVAGDLNTSPAMRDVHRIAPGLTDAAAANHALFLASWPAAGPALWRLDWAFTDPQIRVHTYGLSDPGALSDHRMQDLTISLEPR